MPFTESRTEVHLLICPLKMYTKHELQNIDYLAQRDELHHVPFRGLQHWAIRAGDHIFEVTSNGCRDGKPKYRRIDRTGPKGWWEDHTYNRMMVVDRFMGFTDYTTDEIDAISQWIWAAVMKTRYSCFTTNCQTFASILRNYIVDNTNLEPEVRATLDSLPRPLNPIILMTESANRIRQLAIASGRLAVRPFRTIHPKKEQMPPKLPVRPSQNWLLALRKAGKGSNVESAEAFYELVRNVNKQQRQHRCNTLKRALSGRLEADFAASP